MEIQIGDTHFKSLTELKNVCRSLISSLPIDSCVRLNSAEGNFLFNLILRHSEAEEKLDGIIEFQILRNDYKSSEKVLTIVKLNNRISVSWMHCCRACPSTYTNRVENTIAFRNAVFGQMAKLRQTGHEVHHLIPFKQILASFCTDFGVDIDSQLTTKRTDTKFGRVLNPDISSSWQKYHDMCASYEVITKEEHIELHRNNR